MRVRSPGQPGSGFEPRRGLGGAELDDLDGRDTAAHERVARRQRLDLLAVVAAGDDHPAGAPPAAPALSAGGPPGARLPPPVRGIWRPDKTKRPAAYCSLSHFMCGRIRASTSPSGFV